MSGSIMQFAPVAAPDIAGEIQKYANITKTNTESAVNAARVPLIGAQVPLTQAQAAEARARSGLIGAQTQTEMQQPAKVAAETGLIGAQTAETSQRANLLIPAQATQAAASAASSYATAGSTGQDTYAKRLENTQKQWGMNQSGLYGGLPAPPADGTLPMGPAIHPQAAPYIPPEGQGLLRALSPSESPAANVQYVPPGSGQSPTFDTSQGHPGVGHAGLFQFGSGEWQQAARGAGVDPGDMSLPNQQRAAWWLAQNRYTQQTGSDLATDLKDPANAPKITAALGGTWPSLTGGSQQNQTGATFLQRLPWTVAHEVHGTGAVPPTGVSGVDNRAGVPVTPNQPWNGIPAENAPVPGVAPGGQPIGAASPAGPPAAGAPRAMQPIMIPGMPGPVPGTMVGVPGGLSGTPDQRLQFQTQRANTMQTIFSSQPTPEAGVQAMADSGFITPAQKQTLLANPDTIRNFISQQLPIASQPTPGVKALIERDTPLLSADLTKNEANVDAGMRAGSDQLNLKNIKTLVAGTPDDLMGAAAQTRLAAQTYAKQFGGQWGDALTSKLTGVTDHDVPILQQLQKDFLTNTVSNERTQGLSRIGAMSTAFFAKASPQIDMTKPAVQAITNLGLVAHQMTRDFADASNNFYSTNRDRTNSSLVSGPYQQYQPLTGLEREWLSPNSPHGPDVYAAAANMLNGMPPAEAFKDFANVGTADKPNTVNRAKQVEALHIVRRVDPTATIGGRSAAP